MENKEKTIDQLIRERLLEMIEGFCNATDQKFQIGIASKLVDVEISKLTEYLKQ